MWGYIINITNVDFIRFSILFIFDNLTSYLYFLDDINKQFTGNAMWKGLDVMDLELMGFEIAISVFLKKFRVRS